MLNFRRLFRYHYLKFKRLQGDPGFLSRGVALGIFIGVTPSIPLHTVLILGLSYPFRASKIAALSASVLVSNPFTFFFQYYLSWRLGVWLTSANLSWERMAEMMKTLSSDAGFMASLSALGQLGQEAIVTMLLGGCLLASPLALAGYFLAYRFFTVLRARKAKRFNQNLTTL